MSSAPHGRSATTTTTGSARSSIARRIVPLPEARTPTRTESPYRRKSPEFRARGETLSLHKRGATHGRRSATDARRDCDHGRGSGHADLLLPALCRRPQLVAERTVSDRHAASLVRRDHGATDRADEVREREAPRPGRGLHVGADSPGARPDGRG